MTSALDVFLHGQHVGELVDLEHEVSFRFFRSYWRLANRPVLGQWFEDGESATSPTRPPDADG